ncbi:class D sortase [Bacillus sp. V3B]|uniref:class D sortase n=1 Tax=Bacillus sp. V3B TaxID=2804915 RepID=UPI002108DB73|nr:class D sortase [Bacillus sp. V3B]MCQ6276860.1 class D sortase [Bacillus sp. V3B]
MKGKVLFFGILLVGLGITIYAVWEIQKGKMSVEETVSEAKNLVSKPSEPVNNERYTPEKGEVVGLLEIPKINSELAIIEGTDPDELDKGVGHYNGSYFPGENGQIVLSGHRDTVFKRLGELELGDEFVMNLQTGEFTYKIIATKIVDADDREIITLQNDQEELIVTTCYPFGFIGDAPERYIIYAEPIQVGKRNHN